MQTDKQTHRISCPKNCSCAGCQARPCTCAPTVIRKVVVNAGTRRERVREYVNGIQI